MDTSKFTFRGVAFALFCAVGPAAIGYWQFAERFFPDEPQILQFRLDPPSVLPGERAKLVWHVKNADQVVIQPDIGSVALADSREVQILTRKMYTLTATKGGRSILPRDLIVTPIEPPTPVVHFSADPPLS